MGTISNRGLESYEVVNKLYKKGLYQAFYKATLPLSDN